jgi:serine/threonine protein kinase
VAVQRFLREARTASRLTHGNIVDVSDLGTLPDGRPYLVMPKLQGMDLCTLLEKHGPQTPRRVCELLRGAAAALDLIHAKGFVHRDVKPENLMHVAHEDGSESVLLLDFGIVGLVNPDSSRLTAEGVVFGTPAYLSPEVIRGDTPGPSCDVYALATVAFELLTGSLPFSSPNVMQLLQMKLGKDAPRMSELAGYELGAAVEAAVHQSLAREIRGRHPSAGTFIAALESAVQTDTGALPARLPRLDTGSRKRLEKGNGALELSLMDSLPAAADPHGAPTVKSDPPRAASGTLPSQRARAAAELEVSTTLPMRTAEIADAAAEPATPRSRRLRVGVALALLLAGGSAVWAARKGGSENVVLPVGHMVTPLPAAPQLEEPPPANANDTPPEGKTPQPTAAAALTTPRPRAEAAATRPRAPTPATAALSPARVDKPSPEAPPPPSAAELIERAQNELVRGHLALAVDLYERATRTDPRSTAAFRGLGLVYERLGKKTEAVRALRRAIALAPADPKNALLEARVRKLEGE